MSTDILNKPIVLSLNRAWQVIGHRTVKQALVALTGGEADEVPAVGLDIGYARNDEGWNFDQPVYLNPVSWDEWTALPVREFDFAIHSARRCVRVPTVIISVNYNRMPTRMPRLTRHAIFERDGGICQYTGEHVGRSGGNLDHVIPRHKGGRDSFENLVWAKRSINSLKANRLPHEAGLRLLRKPRAPRPLPAAATITQPLHPDWRHFLTR
jgi:5-methylcytosine-specific restriction endonuclease McrA